MSHIQPKLRRGLGAITADLQSVLGRSVTTPQLLQVLRHNRAARIAVRAALDEVAPLRPASGADVGQETPVLSGPTSIADRSAAGPGRRL